MVIAMQGYDPNILYSNAVAAHLRGDLQTAIAGYRQAIQLRPDFPEALSNLGAALQQIGKPTEALAVYEQAVRCRPAMPELHHNLGIALRDNGKLSDAIACFRRALSLRENFPEAWNNLGDALHRSGEIDQAVAAYQQAIAYRADFAEAHYNLGNALGSIGQCDESIRSYREAKKLRPDWAMNNSNLLFSLHFHPDSTAQSIYAEHQKWNHRHALPLVPAKPSYGNERSAEKSLRIGYVSPDFFQHCQSLFTIPLLSNHDQAQFEIFCYADVREPDAVTVKIKNYADSWRNTMGMSDEQLASLIRSDRIDILIDLTMHMSGGRPLLFARKPAPVQIAWLAYPSTTGLTAMDYRLTDPYLDPPGMNDAFYSEQSIQLPHTFWCYDPQADVPVNALPADSSDEITFGCLNNFLKINPLTLRLWSDVLKVIPNSRLLLMAPRGNCRRRLIDALGVSQQRIEFVEFQPRSDYLKTYHCIDIGLDTFPYNGHTTSLDALWMGVPIVTLCGQHPVARAGFSQCSNLGLNELVAQEPGDFVRIAVELAQDRARLKELRSTLRQRMNNSPLMNGQHFARDVENVYRMAWQTWCERTD